MTNAEDIKKRILEEFNDELLKVYPDGSRRFLRGLIIEDFENFFSKALDQMAEEASGAVIPDKKNKKKHIDLFQKSLAKKTSINEDCIVSQNVGYNISIEETKRKRRLFLGEEEI